jgi:hypothetical protein
MTLREWAVLLKVARGDADIPAEAVDGLVVQGFARRTNGVVTVTETGRVALGLAGQQQKTQDDSPPRRRL